MYLSSLQLYNFRNYQNLDFSFEKRGALFLGNNGTGKTNIIEAIYFLSLGRSQRGASKTDMIHEDSSEAYIEGVYKHTSDSSQASISIGFSRDRKIIMKKDNRRVNKLSELIVQSNIVSFGPQDIMLVYGDPSERRKFIDIVLSQVSEEYLRNLIQYRKSLINRNKLLSTSPSDSSIDIYEEKMADYGSEIVCERMKLFHFIAPYFSEYYSSITQNGNAGEVHYKPSLKGEACEREVWRDTFHSTLRGGREKDATLGFSSSGPHRDDFICLINNRPVKFYGSQGECRIMAFSLRLCSLLYLEKERAGNKIILIDDAFAELDKERGKSIFPLIQDRGQLFITTHSKDEILFDELPSFQL